MAKMKNDLDYLEPHIAQLNKQHALELKSRQE